MVEHAVPFGSGEQVTLPGRAAPGSGPVITRPRVCEADEATTVVLPITAESITLKRAFLTVKTAAPVLTVIVVPLSLARSLPPKLPLPLSVRVTDAVLPAPKLGTMPRTLIHFAFPEGHLPSILN